MIIENAKLITSGSYLKYQVKICSSIGDRTLWYKVDQSFGHFVSDTNDAALLSLLIPAMLAGEDIEVKGKISELLYENLTRKLIKILVLYKPFLKPIKIFPDELYVDDSSPSIGVATGFSGGIDSFSAINDHYYSALSSRSKITHLLFNNVGSHGGGEAGERLFNKRYQTLLPVAEEMGLPFISIDSNLASFYHKETLSFLYTHTIRNAAAALVLQNGIGQYLYASSHSYETLIQSSVINDISTIDSVVLPLLSTGRFNAVPTGGEYNRIEKTLAISKLPITHKTLNICLNSSHQMSAIQSGSEPTAQYTNCGLCKKCVRTLNTLRILDRIDLYGEVFDIKFYKKRELINFMHTMSSNFILDREVVSFAKASGFSLPNRVLIFFLSAVQKTRLKITRCLWKFKGNTI